MLPLPPPSLTRDPWICPGGINLSGAANRPAAWLGLMLPCPERWMRADARNNMQGLDLPMLLLLLLLLQLARIPASRCTCLLRVGGHLISLKRRDRLAAQAPPASPRLSPSPWVVIVVLSLLPGCRARVSLAARPQHHHAALTCNSTPATSHQYHRRCHHHDWEWYSRYKMPFRRPSRDCILVHPHPQPDSLAACRSFDPFVLCIHSLASLTEAVLHPTLFRHSSHPLR